MLHVQEALQCVCNIHLYNLHNTVPSSGIVQQIMFMLLCYCFKSLQQSLAWPPIRLSLLYWLCWVSPCPMLRAFSLTRFRMTSACWLHNSVMKPYEYGILKVICNWGVVVPFGMYQSCTHCVVRSYVTDIHLRRIVKNLVRTT